MKYAISLMIILAILVVSALEANAQTSKGSDSAAAGAPAKKLATDMSFEDLLVQGQYHFSGEAVTTVEQDKVLDGLLGVRTDFKDRIRKSAIRY